MIQPQRNKYLETGIQTASPAQLLIMLYEGAIRACRMAIESIHQHKLEDANKHLNKAQDIVNEFAITLDRTSPIAENLLQMYEYFIFRLTEGNMKKSAEPVEEVMQHLTELKETWIQAAKLAASGKAIG